MGRATWRHKHEKRQQALIYVVSFSVFSSVIMVLVAMLLALEATLVRKGNVRIVINDNTDNALETSMGATLLSVLAGSSAPTACHEMSLLPDANDYQGVPLHDLEPRLRPHRGWGRRELKQEQNNL